MEFTSLVNTSLDLNIKPLRSVADGRPPKQEVESNFIGLGINMPITNYANVLKEELNRVGEENKKLTEMLTIMCENYNVLREQLKGYINNNNNNNNNNSPLDVGSRKRKSESLSESSSSDEDSIAIKKPKEEQPPQHIIKSNNNKISKVYVRTESSDTTFIVKDGYQWRKYGQKVTRDNPSPRAYFKCSFAPSCPVKKKVQRSIEDQSVLVATYEGEHNHPHPSKLDQPAANASTAASRPVAAPSGGSAVSTLNSSGGAKPSLPNGDKVAAPAGRSPLTDTPEFQQFLIEQMASSLTKDPSFKAALVAAISGKFIPQNQTGKW